MIDTDWPALPYIAFDAIYQCDALTLLQSLPDCSINCVVTSPPYFGLRDYGVAGQIGLESTPQAFVAVLVRLFQEARRVLRDDGTLWVNIGDSYAGGGNYRGVNSLETLSAKQASNGGARGLSQLLGAKDTGIPSKNLLGIPWRLAFALQDDGWYLRSDIIWHKPNPMPESVTDRPTKAHEYVFLLSKSERYWYDADAVREDYLSNQRGDLPARPQKAIGPNNRNGHSQWETGLKDLRLYEGRNRRSVWTVPTEPTPFAHFATFPQKLIEPMILAGCPVGGVVLDPFMGSGTTALVARANKRRYVGSELNPEYIAIARERLRQPFEERQVKQETRFDAFIIP